MHGNNKTEAELRARVRGRDRLPGAGLVSARSSWPKSCSPEPAGASTVLIRVTPGIKPSTHSYIQTGQLDSKFGFGLEDGLRGRGGAPRAGLRAAGPGRHPRPHRLADLRARALREDDPAARRLHRATGRVPAAERRRRPRDRLHGGGRAGLDRGLRGREGPRRPAGLRPGAADPGRARAARWSATPG